MPKGSTKTGTQTVTQTNPAAEAQLPYLTGTWDEAKALYQNPDRFSQNYYPGNTVANYAWPDPNLAAGYANLANTGQQVGQNLLPAVNQGFTSAVGGGMGVQNSPAYAGLQNYMLGRAAPIQNLGYYGAQAAGNNNAGLNALMSMTQADNPYLSRAIQGAVDPLVSNYQTAISPQIDAAASQAGRYGSGAQAGMVSNAQQNLLRGIGDVTSGMQNADLNRRMQAAGQYGQLYNQGLNLGLTAADAQSRAEQFGIQGLQSGYQSGNAATLQALGYTPQFLQAQYSPDLARIQAGQGQWGLTQDQRNYQQQLIDADKARYDWTTKLPWTNLGLYQQAIGGALGGSQTTNQPIYGNPTADALSGILGATGIARNLGLFGGSGAAAGGFGAGSSLLGSSIIPGAALNAGNLFGAGSAIAASAAAPASAALPVAASTLPPVLEALGFALPFVGSDRRLKEDDKVVGLLGDLPIHTFRYKGDKTTRIGFMADEVKKIDPGAVATMSNGYEAVHYGRAAQSALNSFMAR